MPFIAGELAAIIRLDGKNKFDTDLRSSGREFTALQTIATGAGKVISGSLRVAGQATNVLIATTAALATKVFATGVSYNTLQQTSRAALSTLLGGAEAANAQMDKLDAFARTSPFAKQVFITAQQQLLGFGLAADKVIPALSAIQDSVAAIGGSNDDISNITFALAQMLGQGKLTGETLNQLGQYGINAAELIAAKMGVTGQEIRDMASSPGGIPADQVWDILVESLTERFGGAAANVKNTFVGAVDRIKAASRDLGAVIAEPFVSKNGGGQAIVWANQVADVIRAVQRQAEPLVGYVVGRLQPAFDGISNTLILAKNTVDSFSLSQFEGGLAKIAEHGPAIGLVLGALISFGTQLPILSQFGLTINPIAGALIGIAAASPQLRDAGDVLLQSFSPLVPLFGEVAGLLENGLTRGIDFVANSIRMLAREKVNLDGVDLSLQNVGRVLERFESYGPAVAGVVGALAAAGPLAPVLGALGLSLSPVAAGILAIVATSPELRDAFGDLIAAGAPLVPLVGDIARVVALSLNAALPVAADLIETVADVAGPLVDIVSQIPGPVLAGALAFLAVNRAIAPLAGGVGGVLGKVGEGFVFVKDSIAASQSVAAETGGKVSALGASFTAAGSLATSAGNAIKTAFLANPIGIALTIVSGAVALWAAANAQAEVDVEAHRQRVDDLRGSLDQTTGSTTAATREMVAQNLAADGLTDKIKGSGIALDEYTDAMLGLGTAGDDVRSQLVKLTQEGFRDDTARRAQETAEKLGVSYDTLVASSLGVSSAQREVKSALEASGTQHFALGQRVGELDERVASFAGDSISMVAALEANDQALAEAKQEAQDYRDALSRAAASMTEAERSNKRLNDALAIARDVSKDAETRLRALKDALDELKGGSMSAEEAQAKLNETNLTLAEGLSQTNDAGVKLWASTLDGAGKIDLTTRAGLAFRQSMSDSADAMLSATQAAYDLAREQGASLPEAAAAATAAGQQYNDSLAATLLAAGLTQEQVDGLIGTYGFVPAVVSTLLTDNGTVSGVDQQVLGLISTMGQVPPGKTITIDEPQSPAVIQRLRDLGYVVNTLPDGRVEITQQGAAEVEAALQELTRPRSAIIEIQQQFTNPSYTGGTGPLLPGSENGNLFAAGRTMQSFENGGVPTGIYKGRRGSILKFAEPNVPWEAFVSGKPGQEERNRRILANAAGRLGMVAYRLGQTRPTATRAFENGGSIGLPDLRTAFEQTREPTEAFDFRNAQFGADAREVVRAIDVRKKRAQLMVGVSRVGPA